MYNLCVAYCTKGIGLHNELNLTLSMERRNGQKYVIYNVFTVAVMSPPRGVEITSVGTLFVLNVSLKGQREIIYLPVSVEGFCRERLFICLELAWHGMNATINIRAEGSGMA